MADVHQFPCTACGADLAYQPGTHALACNHCGQQHGIKVLQDDGVDELDYFNALEDKINTLEVVNEVVVNCSNCASVFEFKENLHSGECPYCGSKIVSEKHLNQHIKPWGLLPFKISSEQAWQEYKKWIGRLWFAPSQLKKYARKSKQLNGMYSPYWTYDSTAFTQYSGQRGTYYQVPTQVQVKVNGRWVTQTRMVTKIRWTPVSGQITQSFNDILVYASQTLPRTIARELEPWDLQHLQTYQNEYLSGFRSEVYQVDLEQGFNHHIDRIKPAIRQGIEQNIGGDTQRINNAKTKYSEIRFRHILLPFWVAGFQFNKKTYQFVVNARTGEVQGDRPYSKVKIFFAIVAAILLSLIVVYFFSQAYLGTDASLNLPLEILNDFFYQLQ